MMVTVSVANAYGPVAFCREGEIERGPRFAPRFARRKPGLLEWSFGGVAF